MFEGTYYKQVFGTAMGSPVSAVIANLVMEDIEHRALTTAPVSPSFWKRFVDDVISAVSQDEIVVLLQHLNSIEPICTRLKEHQRAVSNFNSSKSAFAENVCETSHNIAWEGSRIITTNNRYGQRLCLEAWHINAIRSLLMKTSEHP